MSGARHAAAALLAAAVATGGCGESRSESTTTETTAAPAATTPAPRAAEPPPARVRLSESEYRLDPAQIRVDRPATLEIRVRNRGTRRHALAVDGHGVGARTRTLEPGGAQALLVELPRPGRYRWYCPVGNHERRGMTGAIAVARP